MALVDRIKLAIERGVDPHVFERTAAALLGSRYPWLSPVEAGTDFGRDADLYGVISDDRESRGRLLATTGDVQRNLKRSHKSWLKEQRTGEFRVDALVVATPNAVTATARKKSEEYCRANSLPLPEFYTRDWFINALLINPDWRETLTSVTGRLEAIVPVNGLGNRQLIGREDLLAKIQATVADGGDLVLTGAPGVGKSRLLGAISDSVYMVEPLAKNHLTDDLIRLRPGIVAFDDAHVHAHVLSELARIRAQEGLAFTILAVTWPHFFDEVAACLRTTRNIRVDPLPRTHMDQIVRDLGVRSVHARRVVLDQAEGRPGWAATLCEAFISRSGNLVLSGDVLLDHALRTMRQLSDSELDLDALACVAALNGVSHEDLDKIGDLQKRSGVAIAAAFHRIATSGLLELQQDVWQLQPALRAPLLARWFFGTYRLRPWESIQAGFPQRSDELTQSMLHSARVTRARDITVAAKSWFRLLPSPTEWGEPTLRSVHDFALLDEECGRLASSAARTVLATPRDAELSLWGTSSDPPAAAARAVLKACVQAWFNEEAVHGLLDLAVGDGRPRHQQPEHPIRVLGEMARRLDPDHGGLFEIRPMLVQHAKAWISKRNGMAADWAVYCEVLFNAFVPSLEGTWSDPAQTRGITIANGIETPEHLAELVALVGPAVEPLNRGSAEPVPGPALSQLVALLEEWLRLAGGHARDPGEVSQAQREAADNGAWVILEAIKPLVSEHAGAVLKVWKALDLARLWQVSPPKQFDFPEADEELVLLVGRRDDLGRSSVARTKRGEDQRELARRISVLGPERGISRLVELEKLSSECGMNRDDYFTALELAKKLEDPSAWIAPALKAGAAGIAYRMMWETRYRGLSIELEVLRAGLDNPQTRGAVVAAVLDSGQLDEASNFVIAELNSSDSSGLDRLFAKDEADPVLLKLLEHPVLEIRASAAVAFAEGVEYGPSVPEPSRESWKQAFLSADVLTVDGHSVWRLQEILKFLATSDVGLCTEWFSRRLSSAPADWRKDPLNEIEHILRELPQPSREQLTKIVVANPNLHWQNLLPNLIGHDPELADRLLGDKTLGPDEACEGLTGERDATVEALGPVLLKHGIPAQRIALKVTSSRSWMGEESDALKNDITWFDELGAREPSLKDMCQAAIQMLTGQLDRALAEEKRDSIRGW